MLKFKITTNIIVYMICLINIISIRHIHTLEFSSGWGLNVGQEGINETWINFQYQTSEEIAIKGAEVGIPSLYYFSWTEPDTSKMDPVTKTCESSIKRFANTTHCLTIRHDYKEAWATAFASIQPFIKNKTYIGIFLGDENMWDGASIKNLTTITDMIKTDWPEAIIYVNEAQDVIHCNFNRLGNPIFEGDECFPETLDWYGYDYYCTIPGCVNPYGDGGGWNVQHDGMVNLVYPRLPRKDQKVVPTTLGFFYKTVPFNQSMLNAMDEYCVFTADQFVKWGENDDRVAGLFPFYWITSGGMIGLEDLPLCRARYIQLGESIVNKQQHGKIGRVKRRYVGGGTPGRSHLNKCANPYPDPGKYYWCQKDL